MDNKTNDERKKQMKTISNIIYPAIAVFAFGYFALLPGAQAVSPAPDGGYPGQNTAEGQNALLSLTTGVNNTAIGWYALKSDTTHSNNTAIGAGALYVNNADGNTATGSAALFGNTTGAANTADGALALYHNNASQNTAIGYEALFSNTSGFANTANGAYALAANSNGNANTAIGNSALLLNTHGSNNTSLGISALLSNTTGNNNTAVGDAALQNNTTTGSNNTALGFEAGLNAGGSNNVYIGAGIEGFASDDSVCRIGSIFGATITNGVQVLINSDNRLGTMTSSKRFKQNITPTSNASETLYKLQPVRFQYKKQIDPKGQWQFGLVAEDVEEVNPDLVVRDKEGRPYSVRYDQVNALLLNEFLKEHKAFVEGQYKVETLQSTVATLVATVKEQAAQLQKVSAQLQLKKPTPQTVSNNQ